MTQEENQIKAIAGKRNPYKVPEGYFEHPTFRIPSPAESGSRKKGRFHSYLIGAAAAALILLVSIPMIWWNHEQELKAQEEYELYLYSQMDESTFYDLYLFHLFIFHFVEVFHVKHQALFFG